MYICVFQLQYFTGFDYAMSIATTRWSWILPNWKAVQLRSMIKRPPNWTSSNSYTPKSTYALEWTRSKMHLKISDHTSMASTACATCRRLPRLCFECITASFHDGSKARASRFLFFVRYHHYVQTARPVWSVLLLSSSNVRINLLNFLLNKHQKLTEMIMHSWQQVPTWAHQALLWCSMVF